MRFCRECKQWFHIGTGCIPFARNAAENPDVNEDEELRLRPSQVPVPRDDILKDSVPPGVSLTRARTNAERWHGLLIRPIERMPAGPGHTPSTLEAILNRMHMKADEVLNAGMFPGSLPDYTTFLKSVFTDLRFGENTKKHVSGWMKDFEMAHIALYECPGCLHVV